MRWTARSSAVDREIGARRAEGKADAIFVDFHAEATSEKQAMGHYLDGRASAVVGTHTHVPTADDHILPGGTAYMTDAGMCGDYNSIIGMQKEEPVQRFVTKIQRSRIEPATGEATVCGVAIETDDATGLAKAMSPFRLRGCLRPLEPAMWLVTTPAARAHAARCIFTTAPPPKPSPGNSELFAGSLRDQNIVQKRQDMDDNGIIVAIAGRHQIERIERKGQPDLGDVPVLLKHFERRVVATRPCGLR